MIFTLLDLESVEHERSPAKPSPEDRCPAVPHHRIVSGAAMQIRFASDRDGVELDGPVLLHQEADEPAIVRAFLAYWRGVLVGWNTRGFDVPLLQAAAMEHGIRAGAFWSRELMDRYRGSWGLDLQDQLSMTGAAARGSLDGYSRRMGWPGKVAGHGASVSTMMAEPGGLARVQRYNLQDVVLLAGVLLAYLNAAERISPAQRRAAIDGLLGLVDRREDLAELRAVDRAAVLGGSVA